MTGATLARPPVRHRKDKLSMLNQFITKLPPRFWSKIYVLEDGCWEWRASRTKAGYGRFRIGSVTQRTRTMLLAHRLAYEALVGALPNGYECDHLCRNRACVNPSHVEPVSHRENCLRGQSAPAHNARKTHCSKGHPFDEVNTYRWKSKPHYRRCRKCDRLAYLRRIGR